MRVGATAGDHVASGSYIVSWMAFFFSYLDIINKVVQFGVLVIGLITGIYALQWNYRRSKRE